MHGLLATLRLPVALRGLWATAAAVPSTEARSIDASALSAAAPWRTLARPDVGARPRAPIDAPSVAHPVVAPEPVRDDTATVAAPKPAPVEPSVRVAPAHLVDPQGLRVVPYRPTTRWPFRRALPRIYDPFRGFPQRSAHLAELMDGRPQER